MVIICSAPPKIPVSNSGHPLNASPSHICQGLCFVERQTLIDSGRQPNHIFVLSEGGFSALPQLGASFPDTMEGSAYLDRCQHLLVGCHQMQQPLGTVFLLNGRAKGLPG